MDKYPNYVTYRQLYKRYYDHRSPENFISFAGDVSLEGKSILDLCGGDGRLSAHAVEKGAFIICMIEQQKEMISPVLYTLPKIILFSESVETWLEENTTGKKTRKFDFAFCQQAVNYWLNKKTAEQISTWVKPGGIFLFNSFYNKPSEKPRVQEYEYKGYRFIEVSWLVGKIIHHIQIREGLEPHNTSFFWISPEEFHEMLCPYFEITMIEEGKSAFYRCVKK